MSGSLHPKTTLRFALLLNVAYVIFGLLLSKCYELDRQHQTVFALRRELLADDWREKYLYFAGAEYWSAVGYELRGFCKSLILLALPRGIEPLFQP